MWSVYLILTLYVLHSPKRHLGTNLKSGVKSHKQISGWEPGTTNYQISKLTVNFVFKQFSAIKNLISWAYIMLGTFVQGC